MVCITARSKRPARCAIEDYEAGLPTIDTHDNHASASPATGVERGGTRRATTRIDTPWRLPGNKVQERIT
jgi:hypothetical protein